MYPTPDPGAPPPARDALDVEMESAPPYEEAIRFSTHENYGPVHDDKRSSIYNGGGSLNMPLPNVGPIGSSSYLRSESEGTVMTTPSPSTDIESDGYNREDVYCAQTSTIDTDKPLPNPFDAPPRDWEEEPEQVTSQHDTYYHSPSPRRTSQPVGYYAEGGITYELDMDEHGQIEA